MILPNNTHYFNEFSKNYHCVPDTNSFSYQSSKRIGYSMRLYAEYTYTQKVNGTCFFYTLTYNDNSIPLATIDGKEYHCFNYNDIRLVTNGLISKVLARKYGSRLRYFCACETGEGKGTRGLGSNPHYHFIFFVQPIHKDGKPVFEGYHAITPAKFRSLIQTVWQGKAGFIPYKKCRFGIAKEGANDGLVTGIAAFNYVGKYVLKDNMQLDIENKVREYYKKTFKAAGCTMQSIYYYYKYCNFFSSVPYRQIWYDFGLSSYNLFRHTTIDTDTSYYHWVSCYCSDLHVKKNVSEFNIWLTDHYIPMMSKIYTNDWINKYSGKVRISKNLGEYGLEMIKNIDSSPKMCLPCPEGWKSVTPCLYYYRKLYYTHFQCKETGNVLYRLNERGIALKSLNLFESIENQCTRIMENLSILNNRSIPEFAQLREPKYQKLVSAPGLSEIVRRYCIYNTVYRFRCFDSSEVQLPFLIDSDVKTDYVSFLRNDAYIMDYQHCTPCDSVFRFQRKTFVCFLDYKYHPWFRDYIPLFDLLEFINENVEDYRSRCAKKRFDECSQHQKRIHAVNNIQ